MSQQMTLCIWETEIFQHEPGRAEIVARKPLVQMSVRQAARVMGCERDVVLRAFRAGLITGWKPGARAKRSDGRASNGKIILDGESVLKYKAAVTVRGVF